VSGVLSPADASVVVAIITLIGTLGAAGAIEFRKLSRGQKRITAELSSNGGASMKDQVCRLDQVTADLSQSFVTHEARLARVEDVARRTEAGVELLLRAAGIEQPRSTDERRR
jgi:hypothetical protein